MSKKSKAVPRGITFAPRRGAILVCNFGPDPLAPETFPLTVPPVSVSPELHKVRHVVVVSPTASNHRHAEGPGLCTVVPFSATPPRSTRDHDVFVPAGSYATLTRDLWVRCGALAVVSHRRLDRPLAQRGFRSEFVYPADMQRIEDGIRAALGLI